MSTQTCTPELDVTIPIAVTSFVATAQKIYGDICDLAAWGEVDEPLEKDQRVSSVVACKRNPMQLGRIYGLF